MGLPSCHYQESLDTCCGTVLTCPACRTPLCYTHIARSGRPCPICAWEVGQEQFNSMKGIVPYAASVVQYQLRALPLQPIAVGLSVNEVKLAYYFDRKRLVRAYFDLDNEVMPVATFSYFHGDLLLRNIQGWFLGDVDQAGRHLSLSLQQLFVTYGRALPVLEEVTLPYPMNLPAAWDDEGGPPHD